MKRKLFLSILIIFFTILFMFVVGYSNDKKVDYQLQKQCKKDSEKFFKKDNNDLSIRSYKNHYNKKLNKCFILIDDENVNAKFLYDVKENKRYGATVDLGDKILGKVLEKECKSKSECDLLVKPYMEE